MAYLTVGVGAPSLARINSASIQVVDGKPVIQQNGEFIIPLDSVMFAAYYNPDREFTYTQGIVDEDSEQEQIEVTVRWDRDDALYIWSTDGKSFSLYCARSWTLENLGDRWVNPNPARRHRYARELVERAHEEVIFSDGNDSE